MSRRPCFFLCADKNTEFVLRGFLGRERAHLSLGCGPFDVEWSSDVVVAVGDNDPGLYRRAEQWLIPPLATHEHAVVIMDAAWNGSPGAEAIQESLDGQLRRAGWASEDAVAIVIEPELESWIWQDSPHVEHALGHAGLPSLRDRLAADGSWPAHLAKPVDPKAAMEAVLRRTRKPRSSSIYAKLVSDVSVQRCTDPAFARLATALRRWFPPRDP